MALIACLGLSACAISTRPALEKTGLAASEDLVDRHYRDRTWHPREQLAFDPIQIGGRLHPPVGMVQAKPIGPEYADSLQSLAAKLWLVENARYTLDLAYYIFKRDTVGYALLGGLCNAVKRGVDVRLTIDSGGSLHPTHSELKALLACAEDAGFMRDLQGRLTAHRARVQVVIVNAISRVFVRINRRSHDKLIIMDGHVRNRAVVMTGGRNVSVAYYGINEDGSHDPTAYQDMELILTPGQGPDGNGQSVGDAATNYYSLLFLNSGNKRLAPPAPGRLAPRYIDEQEKSRAALARLMALPSVRRGYDNMPAFLGGGFQEAKVRLAHELGNLDNRSVVRREEETLSVNSNSIRAIYRDALASGKPRRMRIVSPYFFFAQYKDASGQVVFDGAASILKLLEDNPASSFELITNSALTSDNFMAQSVIDMDTAPRMLLGPQMASRWRASMRRSKVDRALVESPEWRRLVGNPRIRIYEMGRLDAAEFGGPATYGKLHAKFMIFDDAGFVGTDNFDYRSRLFNNEFGFFYQSPALSQQLNVEFDKLKANAYAWGSPEWLDMRDRIMAMEGAKARTTRYQRLLYKLARRTGLIWLF